MEVNNIKKTEINEEIRDAELRLIGPQGNQIGIVTRDEALEKARMHELDLVKVAPGAKPPVCKIMDYGKYKYEQAKQEKEARKKQKTIQVKEIRLSVNIDIHDMTTKANHAIKFLQNGDRLKVSLRYKGRQMSRREQGFEVVDQFSEMIKDHGVLEKRPKLEGRSLNAFFSPVKK